jgi:hypothetical protein
VLELTPPGSRPSPSSCPISPRPLGLARDSPVASSQCRTSTFDRGDRVSSIEKRSPGDVLSHPAIPRLDEAGRFPAKVLIRLDRVGQRGNPEVGEGDEELHRRRIIRHQVLQEEEVGVSVDRPRLLLLGAISGRDKAERMTWPDRRRLGSGRPADRQASSRPGRARLARRRRGREPENASEAAWTTRRVRPRRRLMARRLLERQVEACVLALAHRVPVCVRSNGAREDALLRCLHVKGVRLPA